MNTKFSSILFFLFSLIFISGIEAHETGEIKGRVVSDIGTVMNDVNISVVGTDKGTYSNSNGYYSITDVPAGEFVLEASAMGYDTTTKRIKVQASKSIVVDIILFQTPLELSEIVIKGDGFRKRNRSETVTTVLLSTIKELHLTSPLDILNLVPGVEIGAYHQGGVADAFSLRGFSGAGHEGQAAIEVDGVSLNEGEGNHDGYADMNLIIPHIHGIQCYWFLTNHFIIAINTTKNSEFRFYCILFLNFFSLIIITHSLV